MIANCIFDGIDVEGVFIHDAGGNPAGNIVAGTDWQAVKTANYTAVAGQGIFANTSGGSWTLTLPASPSAGYELTIVDYSKTFG